MGKDIKNDKIRGILLNDWDPLNVGENPNLKDEYDQYIDEIQEMICNSVSVNDLKKHLNYITSETIGVKPNEERANTAALKLLSIDFD